MKKFLTALVLIVGAISLNAVAPHPHTLPVGMSFTVVYSPGSGAAQLDVGGEPGGSTGMSLPSTYGQSAESYHATTWMRPGRVYNATFATYGAGTAPFNMGFTAPDGYAVFINGARMDEYYIYTNPPWYGYWGSYYAYFTVQILPITGNVSAPAGSFSGIEIGKSVTWQAGLGTLRNGSGAGAIVFREKDLTTSPVSRARLYYTAAANYNQITSVYDGTGLRQVMTPQTLADLANDGGGNGYWIRFYTPSQGTWNGSSYTVSGSPWRTIRVESPGTNQQKITETEGTVSRVSLLALTSGTVSSGTYQWTLQEGDTSTWLRTTTRVSTNNGGTPNTRDEVVTVRTGGTGGTPVAKTKFRYTTQAWGEELTELTADPDTAALVTTYDYHTTSTALGNWRRVKSVTHPTGNWTSYAYYDDWNRRGQLQVETHPWMDSPGTVQTAISSVGNSVTFDYSSDFSGRYTIPTSKQTYVTPSATYQTGKSLSTRTLNQTINSLYYTRVQTNAYSSSSTYQTATVETLDPKGTNPDYYNQPVSIKRPDQTQDSFVQHFGSYNPSTKVFTSPGDGSHMRAIVFHGSTNSSGAQSFSSYGGRTVQTIYMVPNKSTAEVTIRNAAGLVVRTENWIYSGSGNFATVSYTDLTYDSAGRLTQSVASNGATVENFYVNGRLDYTLGVDNARTNFTYDALGRVLTTKKVGYSVTGYTLPGDVTTTNTYDGASHVTMRVVNGGSLSVSSTAIFDLAGRQTQSVQYSGSSANSITTGTAYSSGGRIVTVTLPSGSQRVTESYLDGQLKQTSGNGAVQQNASYSVESGTGNIKTATYAGNIPTATVTTTSDWLGRKITLVKPAWSGTATYNWYYNTSGQLWKQTQPGVAATLYTYDTLGRLYREGLDVNSNNALDPTSMDRITEHGWTFTFDTVHWWLRDTTSTYPQDNNGTAKQTGKTETLITLPSTVLNYRLSWDIYGNQTANYQILNRSAHLVSTLTDTPDSNLNAEQSAYNGYTVRSSDTAGVTMKFGFDGLGRQNQSIDPRTGTTTTAFIADTNLVSTITDPTPTVQATYAYDSSGRVKSVKDAANNYAYTDYTARGEVFRKWGHTTNPVEFGYDSSGRQTTMKTFRAGTGWTGATWPSGSEGTADTTTWNYQAASGLLSSKVDANSKTVSFTYTTAGQLYQRTWARGVVTTYGYYSTTGELNTVTYSDGSTANLTHTYNRLGAVATVADHAGSGANAREFTYNLTGTLELQHEDLPPYFNSRRLTYTYGSTSGAIGRPSGIQLGTSGNPTADQSVSYGYQADGRFQSLAASGQTFTYGYTGDSHLVATVTNSGFGFTDTRGYDLFHDWVDSRATTVSSANKATFAYTQDSMGRVINVAKTGELFNRYGNGTEGLKTYYGYDAKSQLTSDVTKVGTTTTVLTGRNDSSYAYDSIGNRATATHNGSTSTYTPNLLNQYSQRTVPGVLEVAGASTGATVYVNGVSPTRHGNYFFQDFQLSNGSSVFTESSAGTSPAAKSLNGIVSFNHSGKPIATPTVTGPTGQSVQVLEFQSQPYHVGIDSAQHGYTFQNGKTYTFGYWARAISGTRTVTLMLTDNVNSGITSATFTIGTNWKWVSVTKTYASVGANPRCFYTWDGGGQGTFQAYGAQITDITGGVWGAISPSFLAATPEAFTYDLDGNLTKDGRWDYTYDAENRLRVMETTAAAVTAGVPRQRLDFAYDYLGRRIAKLTQSGWNGSAYTVTDFYARYIYNGWNPVAEINASTGALLRSFFWGMDIAGPGQRAGGIGGLLMIKDGTSNYVPTYDAMGNVHALIKTSDGSLAACYEYDAYGQTVRESGPYAAANPFRYSTKYTDIETGLVYYGKRYYSPSLGRFINRDPIEENGGLNLYGFCANNSVNLWDYLGMETQYFYFSGAPDSSWTQKAGLNRTTEWVDSNGNIHRRRILPQPGINDGVVEEYFGPNGPSTYLDDYSSGNYVDRLDNQVAEMVAFGNQVWDEIDARNIQMGGDPEKAGDKPEVTFGPLKVIGIVEDAPIVEPAPKEVARVQGATRGSSPRAPAGGGPFLVDAPLAELVAWGNANRPSQPQPTGSNIRKVNSLTSPSDPAFWVPTAIVAVPLGAGVILATPSVSVSAPGLLKISTKELLFHLLNIGSNEYLPKWDPRYPTPPPAEHRSYEDTTDSTPGASDPNP